MTLLEILGIVFLGLAICTVAFVGYVAWIFTDDMPRSQPKNCAELQDYHKGVEL